MKDKMHDPCDYDQQEWEIDHGRDWILFLLGILAIAYGAAIMIVLFA